MKERKKKDFMICVKKKKKNHPDCASPASVPGLRVTTRCFISLFVDPHLQHFLISSWENLEQSKKRDGQEIEVSDQSNWFVELYQAVHTVAAHKDDF